MNKTLKLLGIIAWSLLISACSVNSPSSNTEGQQASASHIGQFAWHDLISHDIAASKTFYGQLFDWTFQDVTRADGRAYTLIKQNSDFIAGIVEVEDPVDEHNVSRWLGYLSVADVDAAVAYTKNTGGKLVLPAKDIEMIGRAAAIEDSEGAVLGLISSDLEYPDPGLSRGPGRIVWNELLASDPARAAEFYQSLGKLNIELLSRRGGEYRMLNSDNVNRAGILANPLPDTPSVWLTYISVDDPVEAAERAKSLGGEILIPASSDLREGSMALITDPTGAILVLQKDAS